MNSEWYGSWTRDPEVVNAPMMRPNNNGLNNVMVSESDYQINSNARRRSVNPQIPLVANLKPIGTGELGKNLREPNDSVMEGGAIKNPGWDPLHPRLSRDPSWYPGRGKAKAFGIMNKIGSVAQTIGDMIPEPE
tara:strand:+ start:74 stop:475 length:402 start_codon:yes stop_codon:yes gene_type:complete